MTMILRPSLLAASLLLASTALAAAANGGAVSVKDEQHMVGDSLGIPQRNAANPHVPGATGHTIIIGNHSTIADDSEATEMQRTGNYEPAE